MKKFSSIILKSILVRLNIRSDALQDLFAYFTLGFKKNGTYIDIGSCHSSISNNTYFLAKKGWRGICVEIIPDYEKSYWHRSNVVYLNEDALKIDWPKYLEYIFKNQEIDYLSIDIDQSSLEFLKCFPFNITKPKLITIEHDLYLYGDQYQKEQRELMHQNGYFLAFGNVLVPNYGNRSTKLPFEDWWIRNDLNFNNISINDGVPIKNILTIMWNKIRK